jgi:hypothetical protein
VNTEQTATAKKGIPVPALLLFTGVFALTRLPYFLYYRIAQMNPDTAGYVMIVDQINKGFAPHLSIRTPGYPLFLKIVSFLFPTNFAVTAVQHGLSFAAGILFIWVIGVVFRERRWLATATAGAFAAFISIGWHIENDSSIMTDSLFCSLGIIFLALLILGLYRRKGLILALASAALAAAILSRPAAIALLFAFVLALIFMARNGFARRLRLSFVLPIAGILLSLMTYNALTTGSFAVSLFSEHAMISFASTFLDHHPRYGVAANEAVDRCRAALQPIDQAVLKTSWNYAELNRVNGRYYENNRMRIVEAMLAHEPPDAYDIYLKWRPLWRRMALDAIAHHPVTALKYFVSNMAAVFYANSWHQMDIYTKWRRSFGEASRWTHDFALFGDPGCSFNRRFNARAYSETLTPSGFSAFVMREDFVTSGTGRSLSDSRTRIFLEGCHQRWLRVHTLLFRNPLWILSFLVVLVFSAVRTIKTGFRHPGAFIAFLLTASAAAYGAVIALTAFPYLRYTYSLEYIYYLSPFLWPIMLGPGLRSKTGKGEVSGPPVLD